MLSIVLHRWLMDCMNQTATKKGHLLGFQADVAFLEVPT